MIVELMIYTMMVSSLLGLAAFAIERAVALTTWPRRWLWAGAMVISLAGSAAMTLIANHPAKASGGSPTPVTSISASQGIPFLPLLVAAQPPRVGGPATTPARASLENYAKWLWVAASSSLLGVYVLGALRLFKSRRTWPDRSIGKHQVLVSKDIGPAVFGLVRPSIVVPGWLLNESFHTQEAAVIHESQHVEARDPILLLAALLLLALTPWNFPLWWQLRRLKQAIEVDCDARVLRLGVDRRLYGDTLLRISQYGARLPMGAVAIVGHASQTQRRIEAMMRVRPRHARIWMLAFTAMAVPLVVVAAQLNPPLAAQPAQAARPSAHLGVGLADLDVNADATSITTGQHRGALITYVNPGDPADRAGLRRGDIVVKLGEADILNAKSLALEVARTAPDARVRMTIQRAGANQELNVDFTSSTSALPHSANQVVDTSDWDKLRDANVPISDPALRDELVRMSGLDEQEAGLRRMTEVLPRPNVGTIMAGPRIEPNVREANIRRLREIVAQRGWPTVSMVGVRGSTAAAMIAIAAYGDKAFQADALRLMEPLLQRNEVPTLYYATLFDTVHTPQRFGMMSECANGALKPSKPVEDPEHLEERRVALGLKKAPDFCVSEIGASNTR